MDLLLIKNPDKPTLTLSRDNINEDSQSTNFNIILGHNQWFFAKTGSKCEVQVKFPESIKIAKESIFVYLRKECPVLHEKCLHLKKNIRHFFKRKNNDSKTAAP